MSNQFQYGWTCTNCGAFVGYNQTHQCPSQGSHTVDGYKMTVSSDTDILDLLRQILGVLKEIEYNTRPRSKR